MRKGIFAIFLGIILLPQTCFAGTIDLSSAKDSQELWLINRNCPVSEDYYATDLKNTMGSSYLMRENAANAYGAMDADLKKAGVGDVHLRSTYRSFKTQTYLFYTRLAESQKQGNQYDKAYAATARFTAVPGTSEHQSGLAVDVTVGGSLSASFGSTPQGKWVAENSWKYGYILRYVPSKENFTMIGNEPWHFRYIGAPHAEIVYKNGWCFEEYIYNLKSKGKLQLYKDKTNLYEIYYFPSSQELPKQIANSDIASPAAWVRCSSDNAGGYIVTVYGKYDSMKDIYACR